MPSKYLFLSEFDSVSISSGRKWDNLPVLSEATRECYISVLDCAVIAEDPDPNALNERPVQMKLNIPSMNYFSSDNSFPVMKQLIYIGSFAFAPNLVTGAEILTNDNLKSIEVTLTNLDGDPIPFAISAINLTLKIDYVDQQEMAQTYLSQKPRTL